MVTEIQQRPSVGNDQLEESNQSSGDALRPDLEGYEDYNNRQNNSRNRDFESSQPDLEKGSLICTPLVGFDDASDGPGDSKTDDPNKVSDKPETETNRPDEEGYSSSEDAEDSEDSQKRKKDGSARSQDTQNKKDDKQNPLEESGDFQKGHSAWRLDKQDEEDDKQDPREYPEDPKEDNTVPDIEAQGAEEEKQNPADNAEHEIPDDQRIELSPEAQKAKDDFVKIFEDRLKDDPRIQNNPQLLQELEARMDQMDQRILHEHPQSDDGSYVDEQGQLTQEYRNLARIGTDAEKLMYTAEDGSQQQVFSEPWMVNNILASGIVRGADPEHFYEQGANNTCAAESISRGGMDAVAGEDSKTIADMCTKGEFEAVDKAGKVFTCRVNRASLIPDREALNVYLSPTNARDAYGQMSDIRTAQLNLDLMMRDEYRQQGKSGGAGVMVYSKVAPINRRDTGERVTDTRTGQVVANNPCFYAESESDTKKSLYGRAIGREKYGEETTLVAKDRPHGNNVTEIASSTHLSGQLHMLRGIGLMAHVITKVENYVDNGRGLGGAQGNHATSAEIGKDGGINFINNWGGRHNYNNLSADTLFAWMNEPQGSFRGSPGLNIGAPAFGAGRGYGYGEPITATAGPQMDQNKSDPNKENELLAQLRKEHQKEDEDSRRQMQHAHVQFIEIESRLAALPSDSPQKMALLKQRLIDQNSRSFT